MRLARCLVLAGLVVVVAACTGPAQTQGTKSSSSIVRPTATSSTAVVAAHELGRVCGVTTLAGGPPSAVGVKDPAFLHRCPTSPRQLSQFRLMASNGKVFDAYSSVGGWSARVPSGTYRVIDRPYCGDRPGPPFVVTASKTLLGVVVWVGCTIS
jgi:hypothetical protein